MSAYQKVLIVDDEPTIASLLEDILDRNDFETYSVDSAERALSMLETMRFDIVITDYEMGGMDGSQLARIIKAHYPEIFVIGISGNQTGPDFLAAGADVFLAKPLDFDKLLTGIEKGKKQSC